VIVIHLSDIVLHYGAQLVLDGASLAVEEGSKIGLVGANGVGKSTLLKIIAGELRPDAGQVFRMREQRIGYLAQQPDLDPQETVWQAVVSANAPVAEAAAELHRLERRMADPVTVSDARALERTLRAYDAAQHRYEQLDGYTYESRVREALQSLGLGEETYDQAIATLSGGQRKLVGVARLLASGANTLLLDEPDNHLDLAHKADLERFIAGFSGTVILVSHDRYLLDQTVDTIAEVEAGRVRLWPGNYTTFAADKELYLLRQQQRYQAQQKEIARIEEAIARFELWASQVVNERHARQARSRRKMLDRMDKIERPNLEQRRMGLELNGWRGSNKVLEIADLDVLLPDPAGEPRIVLAGLNLLLRHGERVGLLGPNGAGKTVLLRTILGAIAPTAGAIRLGPSVRVGYYAQEHETLDPARTLIEEVRLTRSMYEDQAVALLGRFLFPYAMAGKRVGELSGGERSRMQLVKLMLSDCNLLLLDEPTNNLDLPSCEVLEAALASFEGTVLAISHDRYFLDRVVDRVVELEDGALIAYTGDYTYYREVKEGLRAG
jgi:ATP-binding cassette subfamily F protein 3